MQDVKADPIKITVTRFIAHFHVDDVYCLHWLHYEEISLMLWKMGYFRFARSELAVRYEPMCSISVALKYH